MRRMAIVGAALGGVREWFFQAAAAEDGSLLSSLEPFVVPLSSMQLPVLVRRVVWITPVCASSRCEVAPSCWRY